MPFTYFNTISPAYILTVAKSGGQFDSIQAAIDYALANYILDADHLAIVKVAPGLYAEQLTTTSQYIRVIGMSADPSDQPKSVILYNTGADVAHYPLAISTGTLYLEGITIRTEANAIFGLLRNSNYAYCHFEGGHFIESAAVNAIYMNFESCTATDDIFNLTGVAGGERFIALRDCDLFSGGMPVFGSSQGTIKFQDTMCANLVTVSGGWSVICQGVEFYGGGKFNLDTTGDIFIHNSILSAGLHFVSDPAGTKVITNNSFVGPTVYIGAGEGDITADVAITNVDYSGNTQYNGIDGEIQIGSLSKNIGNGALDAYRDFQEALDSIWEHDSIVHLGDNVTMTAPWVLPDYMFTVDGHRIYGMHSTHATHCDVTAGKVFTLSRLTNLSGGEFIINGNGARLTLTQCGRMLDFEPVSVRFRIANGDATSELRLKHTNLQGDSVNHYCVKIDHASPVIVVSRSTMRGYTGHPALRVTVQIVGTWRSKYSTFMHGSGGLNEWCTADIANTEFRSYLDSYNAGSMVAPDTLANVTNQITKPGNTNDVEITY